MNTYLKRQDLNTYLQNYSKQISDILSFDKDLFISKLCTIRDIYIHNFIKISSDNDIKRRVYAYFDKQNHEEKIGSIKAIIKFQHIIVTYVNKLLQDLIDHNFGSKYVDLLTSTSVTSQPVFKIKTTDNILNIMADYLCKIRLQKESEDAKVVENDDITNKIKTIIENIITSILVIKNSECVVYGSFTCFNIDCSIGYNDIDIYSINAYKIMIFFMVLLHFVIGYDTYLFSIPFIEGHIALKYKSVSLIDCIFIHNNILNCIPKITINNMYFIDPGMQMLNNFRMLSENFRAFKINNDFKNSYIKYVVLLEYYLSNCNYFPKKLSVNKTMSKQDIPYTMFKSGIKIHIKDIIPESIFDFIIIIWQDPGIFMNFLSKLNGKFSMKYGAFLNEIFFENTSYTIKKSSIIAGNVNIADTCPEIINEDKIKKFQVENIDVDIDLSKKNLIFSNLTTSTYIYEQNDYLDISVKNLVSFIATTALYSFLHKQKHFGIQLYTLLINMLTIVEDRPIKTYSVFPRYKRKGEHIEISMSKNLFKSIFNTSYTTNDDYMNYETFIENTNINGGF